MNFIHAYTHTQKSIKTTTFRMAEQEKKFTYMKQESREEGKEINAKRFCITCNAIECEIYIFQSHLYIKSSVKSSGKLLNYTRSPTQSVTTTRRKKLALFLAQHFYRRRFFLFHSCTRRENES